MFFDLNIELMTREFFEFEKSTSMIEFEMRMSDKIFEANT
jgi:hypothetical protein